ncbi:ATP synthase subunit delta [Longispora fulva]|uniref:ATP synthase subunit delta n=1 Tax=Longispora fulva TaxID=619741 RepID=A0A8J7GP68_9ACTN|nr:F0F1 ATP synthase subunit delta [Longispora fulva]MBG6140827.1 F-type H+-transporting ATPase subunit delta [Longispora fulva]GIG60909.1 ATP synthase subunit delta [Longispora fulva]
MQAASRESYAAARAQLDSYASSAPAGDVAATAGDVLGAAVLLGREPSLRRALADANRTGADRSALLNQILAGKISEGAAQLLGALVSGHWSRPTDLVNATERLGAEALLASAESSGQLADVEDELFRLGQVVAGDSRLASAVGDTTAELTRRVQLVGDLLAGKATPVTARLAELAVSGFEGRNFDGSVSRLVELAAERRNRSVAYVTVAVPMTDEQERRLVAELARRYGREITAKVTVDPEILGGISVRVGHDLYDGTILRRLAETRNALAGRN